MIQFEKIDLKNDSTPDFPIDLIRIGIINDREIIYLGPDLSHRKQIFKDYVTIPMFRSIYNLTEKEILSFKKMMVKKAQIDGIDFSDRHYIDIKRESTKERGIAII